LIIVGLPSSVTKPIIYSPVGSFMMKSPPCKGDHLTKKDCKSKNLSSGSMSMLSAKPYYAWLAVAAKEKDSLINALGGTGMAV
jgi:hypothetical protein